ncbi:unnamed protein product [Symbiodinium necroappetens]|uniref:Uncharacterized protein n=1 Tax=Symbiodinium necroappetens TaxID=1628268 RepID=A0A812WHJ1_9DINO|nr:unnamed protein product [Symbiodinium necroappetens]
MHVGKALAATTASCCPASVSRQPWPKSANGWQKTGTWNPRRVSTLRILGRLRRSWDCGRFASPTTSCSAFAKPFVASRVRITSGTSPTRSWIPWAPKAFVTCEGWHVESPSWMTSAESGFHWRSVASPDATHEKLGLGPTATVCQFTSIHPCRHVPIPTSMSHLLLRLRAYLCLYRNLHLPAHVHP